MLNDWLKMKPLLLTIALLFSIVSDSYAENDEEFVEELTVGYMLDNKDKSDVFYRIIGTMHGILFSEVYFQDKEYRKKICTPEETAYDYYLAIEMMERAVNRDPSNRKENATLAILYELADVYSCKELL